MDDLFRSVFRPINPNVVHDDLELGYSLAALSSIQFLTLARDASKHWPRFIQRVERLGSHFKSWSLACYENDSRDGTASLIGAKAAQDSRVRLLSESLGKKKWASCRSPSRGKDMGVYRERLRSFALDGQHRAEFIAVLDVDIDYWFPESFLSAFPASQWHDAVWALGVQVSKRRVCYYDAWATRVFNWGELSNRACVAWMARLWPGSPVEPVLSGFGGGAIYRRDFYERGSYLGDDCEHVNFHRSAKRNDGPVGVIHPNMIFLRNGSHSTLRIIHETAREFASLNSVL